MKYSNGTVCIITEEYFHVLLNVYIPAVACRLFGLQNC